MKNEFGLNRKIVAHAASLSWKKVPHVAYLHEPDVTDAFATYRRLKAELSERRGLELSFNAFLLRILAEALKAAPSLNASFRYSSLLRSGRISPRRSIDIAVPWALGPDRMVPIVLRNVGSKTFVELSAETADIARRNKNTDFDELLSRVIARDTINGLRSLDSEAFARLIPLLLGKSGLKFLRGSARKAYGAIPPTDRLTESDILGGTTVVSNVGSLDTRLTGAFTLLEIIPPNVTAFGVGAVREEPRVVSGGAGTQGIAVRKVLPLCVAFDHRALDFSALVPFFKRLDGLFGHTVELESFCG